MKLKKTSIRTKFLIFTIIIEFALACYLLYSGQYSQALLALSITLVPSCIIFESTSKKDK